MAPKQQNYVANKIKLFKYMFKYKLLLHFHRSNTDIPDSVTSIGQRKKVV